MKKIILVLTLVLLSNSALSRPITNDSLQYGEDYITNLSLGRVPNARIYNKFAEDFDLDVADGQVTIWELGERLSVLTTASTFDILYNSTTDGAGTTGALTLAIEYVDENRAPQTLLHTLGNDGSDTTTITGLGVNRVALLTAGSALTNTNAITLQASSDSSNQAYIPALTSVTQQCFFFMQADHTSLMKWLFLAADKITGGNPVVTFDAYIHNFLGGAHVVYKVFNVNLDTNDTTFIELNPNIPFVVEGSSLIEFTSLTTANNTKVNCRFSLAETKNL